MFHYGYYFKHINIEINKYIQQHLQTLDLTKPQMDILFILHKHKDHCITLKELQDQLQLSYPTLTGLVHRLESKGYVERRINEKDKRIHYIVETEEAKKIHHQIRHVFQDLESVSYTHLDLESQLMKNIDEPAQQSLQSMLIQILQNIEMEEKTC